MVAMSLALLANGIALTSLFAYVGFMVTDLGISPDTNAAGFTAGYISGAFMIGRLFSSFFWGSFSDHVGRKPVLYLSLAAIVIFSVLFGCSTTFAMALSSRLLIGFFNAIVGTCRTAISEICGPYYEVRGMGFLMGSWSVSFVIGPAIGGLLARPAVQYPGAFGTGGLFGRFPYLLPNLVAAAVAAVALPCVYFVMPETVHRRHGDGGKRDGEGAEREQDGCNGLDDFDGFDGFGQPSSQSECEASSSDEGNEDPEARATAAHGSDGAGAARGGNGSDAPRGGFDSSCCGGSSGKDLLAPPSRQAILAPYSDAAADPEAAAGGAEQLETSALCRPAAPDHDTSSGDGGKLGKESGGGSGAPRVRTSRRLTDDLNGESDAAAAAGEGFAETGGGESGSTESSEPPSPPPPPHKTDGAWAARGERRSAGTVGDSAADGGNRNGGGRSRIRVRKSAAPPPGDGSPAPDEPSLSGCAALPHLLGGAGGRLRRALLGTYGLFSFLSIIYDEVLPLWCITSVTAGGLGWGTGQVGKMLSISGLFLVCFQFAMFPPLARRLGVVRFMKAALALLVPLYLLFPLAGRLAGRSVSLDATVVALSIAAKSMSNVVFASHALCTNNAVETEARGSFNGLMMTAGSAAKGTAPAVGSIIYAWSVTTDRAWPLDFHFSFYLLALLCAVLLLWIACTVPPAMMTAEERSKTTLGEKEKQEARRWQEDENGEEAKAADAGRRAVAATGRAKVGRRTAAWSARRPGAAAFGELAPREEIEMV